MGTQLLSLAFALSGTGCNPDLIAEAHSDSCNTQSYPTAADRRHTRATLHKSIVDFHIPWYRMRKACKVSDLYLPLCWNA